MNDAGRTKSADIKKGQATVLAAGHLINDTYGGFIAPLLPYFVVRWGLSLAEAGILVTAFFTVANFSQLFFGWLTDRRGGRWFLSGGVFVAAIFLGSLGAAPSFWWAIPWVVIGAVGAAAFHPPAAGLARRAGGRKGSLVTSIFLQSGFLGMALGPLEILAVVERFGLEFSYLSAAPGVLIACLLFKCAGRPKDEPNARRESPPTLSAFVRTWPSLSTLWTVVVLRSVTNNAFAGFLPLLMVDRGVSKLTGGTALTVYLVAGAVGGLVGGYLGDRGNRRRLICMSLFLGVVFLWGFLLAQGPLSLALLVVGGGFFMLSGPINLVMAQELNPERTGLVSSLMMGGAYGTGSLVLVAVGAVADQVGMHATLAGVTAIGLIASFLSLRLPKENGPPRPVFADVENPGPGLES